MQASKPFYTSKVLWVNVVAFLIAAVDIVQLADIFPPDTGRYFALVLALLNLLLRFVTTQAVTLTGERVHGDG